MGTVHILQTDGAVHSRTQARPPSKEEIEIHVDGKGLAVNYEQLAPKLWLVYNTATISRGGHPFTPNARASVLKLAGLGMDEALYDKLVHGQALLIEGFDYPTYPWGT